LASQEDTAGTKPRRHQAPPRRAWRSSQSSARGSTPGLARSPRQLRGGGRGRAELRLETKPNRRDDVGLVSQTTLVRDGVCAPTRRDPAPWAMTCLESPTRRERLAGEDRRSAAERARVVVTCFNIAIACLSVERSRCCDRQMLKVVSVSLKGCTLEKCSLHRSQDLCAYPWQAALFSPSAVGRGGGA